MSKRGRPVGQAPADQTPIEGEEWRPVPPAYYAPHYSVSNMGRIRRNITGRIKQLTWSGHENWLYRYVSLSHLDVHHSYRVATLVAGAFLGPKPDPLIEVNHKNGDHGDNTVANLEYVTKTENEAHAAAHGLKRRGVEHHAAKLTEDAVREIRAVPFKGPIAHLISKYGVNRHTINNIRSGRTWRHVA